MGIFYSPSVIIADGLGYRQAESVAVFGKGAGSETSEQVRTVEAFAVRWIGDGKALVGERFFVFNYRSFIRSVFMQIYGRILKKL